MAAQLRVAGGKDIGKVFALTEGQPLLIGRDMSTHTRLKDPHVAMLHCQVLLSSGAAVLTDRGSSGGTFVNGQRITEHTLQPGDIVRVGDTKISFEQK
jgi:pSer/pThr/pTyr-binding forkhead associated (FHA) protein